MNSEKKMGFWTVTSIVVGGMIGSGVFLLPSSLAEYNIFGLWCWLITGIGSLFLALTFAGLCARLPKTGGPHVYIEEAFGVDVGFLGALIYWLAAWVSVPGIAIGTVTNLAILTPYADDKLFILFLQFITMGVVAWINLKGVYVAGIAELIFTVLKLVPLILIPLCALPYTDFSANVSPLAEGADKYRMLTEASVIAIWGYLGVEAATTPAGSVENPAKTIPRALIIGTIATTLVYILGTFAIMGMIPDDKLATMSSPYAVVTNIIFGKGYDHLISLSIAIVCLGTLQATVLTNSQISYGAAMTGLFPKIFAKLNIHQVPTFSVTLPILAILAVFVVMVNVDIMQQFSLIIEMATLGYVAIYLLCSMAFFKLLMKEKNNLGKFLNILVAIVSAIFSGFILINIHSYIIYYFTIVVLISYFCYLINKKYIQNN